MTLAGLLLLAACSRMPQVHYYDFDLPAPAPATATATQPALLWVQPFTALPPCDQDRMVYRDSAYEVRFDAYRRWIAPPPELLRERLVAWLRASGRFVAVATAMPRQSPFTALAVQLVRFDERVEAGRREAVLRFWFEVTDEQGGRLNSGYIEGRSTLAPGDAQALVNGMRAAAEQAFTELLSRL
jgi:uncharacterized lipoprotein YmbA